VIVALTLVATALVVILNVPDVAPAAIVIDPGITALTLFEVRVIVAPPGPAGLLNVTVPTDDTPPATVEGVNVNPLIVSGVIVNTAVCWETPIDADIVADTELDTEVVDTVNVVELAPAGTVTLDGNLALKLVEERVTTAPLGPAEPDKVTVAVEETPPITDVGERLSPVTVGGVIVSPAVCVKFP